MISYEASKWNIKLWRKRWYIYAIFLYIKEYLTINIFMDLLLYQEIDGDDKERIRKNWKDIKKHVELSKMRKYSTK